jgi:hypothetical protein
MNVVFKPSDGNEESSLSVETLGRVTPNRYQAWIMISEFCYVGTVPRVGK